MDDYLCTQVDETIIFAVYMELIDIFSWSHPDGRRVREVAEEKAIERLDKDHPLGRQRLPRILREIYSLYYSIKIYEAQGEDCRWFLQNPDTDILNRRHIPMSASLRSNMMKPSKRWRWFAEDHIAENHAGDCQYGF
jgi:hypothetical protein